MISAHCWWRGEEPDMPAHPQADAVVRIAVPGDAAAIAGIYRPYVTDAATSFELDPPDAGEMTRRMAALAAFAPWLVYAEAQDVVGYAYASPHRDRAAYRWSVDVTVYIRGDRHRRGIGRALYRTLFPLLALQGFRVAHAGITLPNAGSVGLHESLGFTPVGVYPAVGWKQGSWHDVGWWRRPLADLPPAPAPPLSLPAARALASWPPGLAPSM
jgi:L-amino acid N-acyltransferase YncA